MEGEDVNYCEHWLLDQSSGGLHPEDEVPCGSCNRTWEDLLFDYTKQTAANHSVAFCYISVGEMVSHFLVHEGPPNAPTVHSTRVTISPR